jgi:hypothetical protein
MIGCVLEYLAARALAPTSRAKRPGGSDDDAKVDAVQHGRQLAGAVEG